MKYVICFFALTLSAGVTSSVHAQSESNGPSKSVTDPQTETKYLLIHQEADPRFITSIERIGQCELPGPPLPTESIRLPWQMYPGSPGEKREEGKVVMQFFFDHDWCIRKAAIIKSSGHWSLDSASLRWGMTLKWSPKKTLFTAEGEPTVTLPIVWGGSHLNR
jgi:hypothetical protein